MNRFLTTAGLALALFALTAVSPAQAQQVVYYQPSAVYYGPPAPPVYSYSFYTPTTVYRPGVVVQPTYYPTTVYTQRPLRPWLYSATTYYTPTVTVTPSYYYAPPVTYVLAYT